MLTIFNGIPNFQTIRHNPQQYIVITPKYINRTGQKPTFEMDKLSSTFTT